MMVTAMKVIVIVREMRVTVKGLMIGISVMVVTSGKVGLIWLLEMMVFTY